MAAKYLAKTFGEERDPLAGLHRYDVAEGFKPKQLHLTGTTAHNVIEQASTFLGAEPVTIWTFAEAED